MSTPEENGWRSEADLIADERVWQPTTTAAPHQHALPERRLARSAAELRRDAGHGRVFAPWELVFAQVIHGR
jgi:hypothetical protein